MRTRRRGPPSASRFSAAARRRHASRHAPPPTHWAAVSSRALAADSRSRLQGSSCTARSRRPRPSRRASVRLRRPSRSLHPSARALSQWSRSGIIAVPWAATTRPRERRRARRLAWRPSPRSSPGSPHLGDLPVTQLAVAHHPEHHRARRSSGYCHRREGIRPSARASRTVLALLVNRRLHRCLPGVQVPTTQRPRRGRGRRSLRRPPRATALSRPPPPCGAAPPRSGACRRQPGCDSASHARRSDPHGRSCASPNTVGAWRHARLDVAGVAPPGRVRLGGSVVSQPRGGAVSRRASLDGTAPSRVDGPAKAAAGRWAAARRRRRRARGQTAQRRPQRARGPRRQWTRCRSRRRRSDARRPRARSRGRAPRGGGAHRRGWPPTAGRRRRAAPRARRRCRGRSPVDVAISRAPLARPRRGRPTRRTARARASVVHSAGSWPPAQRREEAIHAAATVLQDAAPSTAVTHGLRRRARRQGPRRARRATGRRRGGVRRVVVVAGDLGDLVGR